MNDLSGAMAALLADAYLMYAHAHIAHWNITGEDFSEHHRFLNDLYDDVYDSVDGIAERTRALGQFIEPGLHAILARGSIVDGPVPRDWQGVRAILVRDNNSMTRDLQLAISAASGNPGLQNFLADRLDRHAKWGWMLQASA